MGFLGIVALVGFYDTLREAGPVMILASVLGAVGLTLVTVSHLLPIEMAYELVPAYVQAAPAGQAPLATTLHFAATAQVANAAGNFLGWGVVVPLYVAAILITRALPRWIGWLGLLVGFLAGWLGLLSPASGVIISNGSSLGFIGFFIFMLRMGVALLRRPAREAKSSTGVTTTGRIVNDRCTAAVDDPHDRRPAHPERSGDRINRRVAIGDLRKRPPAGAFGQHRPRRHRLMRLGPRPLRTRRLRAAPDAFVPAHHHRPSGDRQIPHPHRRRSFVRATTRHCGHPAHWAVVSTCNSRSPPTSAAASSRNPANPKSAATTDPVTSPSTWGSCRS
jgi:hypothetical protein